MIKSCSTTVVYKNKSSKRLMVFLLNGSFACRTILTVSKGKAIRTDATYDH